MDKQLHGMILKIVGILAVISAAFTFVDIGIELVSALIETSFNFSLINLLL